MPRVLHPAQLGTAFRDVVFFTGRSYVVVWSDTELEILDPRSMSVRLGSYSVLQENKAPRRLSMHELARFVSMRDICYEPSKVRVDSQRVYLWPVYAQPCPRRGDVDALQALVDVWFKSDPQ